MRNVLALLLALVCTAALSEGFNSANASISGKPAAPSIHGFQGTMTVQAGKATVTYADVAGIFQKSCVMCHSGAKPPKGLLLDSYARIMAGAAGEKMIVPGSPDKSELLKRIKGTSKPRMPRNGPPWLTDNETALIEKWIAGGAPEGGKS